MIKNYFKIAFRNIKRYTAHSVLNIIGMATGMACALLILLWVLDEISYDRFNKNADDLFRVVENQHYTEGEVFPVAVTPTALASALKEKFPEIIKSSRFQNFPIPVQKGDEYINESLGTVDNDFIEMYGIKFIHGDPKSALSVPHNIVLTEEMANKYFNGEDPVGKTLTIMKYFTFTVTGVVQGFPLNSHISFDFLGSYAFLQELGVNLNDWSNNVCYTYVELNKGSDVKLFDEKIRFFLKNYKEYNSTLDAEISLQNIKRIHLYSSGKYAADIGGLGDIANVRIMALIAVFILLIACINFMNLSTAQSVRRAGEIGVRRVAGASKRNIVLQFLGESLIMIFIAHIIAMILVELLLPAFSSLIGKQLDINYQSATLYLGLIIVILFCGLLAGSYPALYLSSLSPLNIIRGNINKNPGSPGFRRALVIFQFTLSVMLIICTLIVGSQLKYMQNKKLGLNKDNLGYFQFSMGVQRATLKRDLANNPDILNVSIADQLPCRIENSGSGFEWTGKAQGADVLFHFTFVDEDYAKTLHLEVKEGRFFSAEYSTDTAAIVINEKAAEILGFRNSIGEELTKDGSVYRIIGIIKDFHYQSLHAQIEPLILFMNRNNGFICFIKMKPDHIASTVESVKKTLKSYNLAYSVDFKFLDDDFRKLYETEQRTGRIFGYFSFLAIIISCLGLIGLSSFLAVRKTKEIGIRKANGARTIEIFSLLSGEYAILVFISFLIASPVAWFAMHKWLQNYAYHINIGWIAFVLAGGVTLVFALLTVGFQSYKASNKNPVDALRYE
jgi:putative ABC transport system permease protein